MAAHKAAMSPWRVVYSRALMTTIMTTIGTNASGLLRAIWHAQAPSLVGVGT